MTTNPKIYCKLAHFCQYDLNERVFPETEEIQYGYSEKIYVEKYYDFDSVKAKILELNRKWEHEKKNYKARNNIQPNYLDRKGKSQQNSTDSQKSEKANTNSDTSNFQEEEKLEIGNIVVLLYNQWGDRMDLGYYQQAGWLIFDHFHLTLEYQQKLSKLPENFFDSAVKKQRIFLFESPNPTWRYEYEFTSEEYGDALIKEWLDTGSYTMYFNMNRETGTVETNKYDFEEVKKINQPSITDDSILNEHILLEKKKFKQTISEIDNEMNRLDWTIEDGQNYLFQNYGVTRRRSLTKNQLAEFLQYLKQS
jgi:hypothetical protein